MKTQHKYCKYVMDAADNARRCYEINRLAGFYEAACKELGILMGLRSACSALNDDGDLTGTHEAIGMLINECIAISESYALKVAA